MASRLRPEMRLPIWRLRSNSDICYLHDSFTHSSSRALARTQIDVVLCCNLRVSQRFFY
jgi:hypothetical protein